ncbi:hypothetical protein CDL12_14404 [Handroanthus impetiginosus]|uniref:NADP-dependent oxidoreductase domain-containing protein n=1 Tax=Handroanthus impetiginosus TaxID=429701 RepID=A0A2G9H635_9LAMI|nr:hypothetical protein CDL12_14404 [Handroanthus impetiginosus]
MKKEAVGYKPENLVATDIPGTWKAMEAVYDSGKARAIGISNFSKKKLGDLLDIARIPPAVNQVECHPSWQQHKLREFCKFKGVHLSGYSPLGSPGTTWLKGEVLKHPVLGATAEKLGKTPAQVALRWGLQMGHIVLPKSTNESRIKENLDVFSWSIPDDLFAKFSEIEQTLSQYKTMEDLWDGEIQALFYELILGTTQQIFLCFSGFSNATRVPSSSAPVLVVVIFWRIHLFSGERYEIRT